MNSNGFKNKSERNAGYQTEAMKLFKGKSLLNERPIEMPVDVYHLLRKMQSEAIKMIFHKGHSPSRKLSGIMGTKQPNIRIQSPTTKRRVNQRKTQ